MFRKLHKLNNSGSTLLTVMICLAIVSILGSLMLSVTLTNLQMKIVESKSKKNFYSCDAAMEELRTGLQELTAETIKEVYNDKVLTNYAAYIDKSEDEVNTSMQNMVTASLMKKLSDSAFDESELVTYTDLPAKVSEFTKYLTTVPGAMIEVTIESLNSAGNNVLVKGIHISYTKDDYKTSIDSDIRIILPKFTFTDGPEVVHYRIEQPFGKYVLVADGGIISSNSAGKNEIKGSVYAGDKGITVKNSGGSHGVDIAGEDIVTRGNITAADRAKLSIDPFTGADGITELPFIWADNLITETSSNFTSATTMNIRGISIIKDDLVLDGYNSDVNLLSGAYIGYTGTHSAKGSAIMINGSGSSLNLSGLSSLMLAGRANVSVDNTVSPADKNAVTDILTGESVAIKSDQKAYLIPGRFLRDILHNPVTKADTDAFGTPVVDFGLNPQPGDLNYNSYVSPSTKFKIAAKQTGEGSAASTLRYYYLNFAGGKLADQYLQDYIAMSSLDNMEPFTLDSLVLPPADNIKAVGNVMSYPGSGGSVKLTKGLSNAYSSDSELDNAFQSFGLNGDAFIGTALQGETVGKLANDYSKMTHLLTLTDSDKVYQESDQVVGSMIKAGGVSYITKEENNISLSGTDYELMKSERDKNLTDIDPAKQYITVVDGNLTVPAGKVLNGFFIASGDILIGNNVTINGIVISSGEKNASGDITLGNNITVNGRIVARNDIILGTDCVIRTNDSSEAFMKSIFENEGSFLENLFRNMKMTINFTESLPASNLVDLSDMISYENWHRTE